MRADRTSADHRQLATRALTLLAGLAVPTVAIGGWAAGIPGATGALIGVAFVALLFGASSASLAWAIEHAPSSAVAVLSAGAFVRLATYAVVLSTLSGSDAVHPTSLAIATGVATAVTLAAELVWLARTPRLFHLEAPRPTAASTTESTHACPGHEASPSCPEHVPTTSCLEHVATGSRSL